MHVDALTLAAVADELRASLVGARIEDVIQPTPHAVALQCWAPGRTSWLLASAHPQLARAHLIDRKPQKLASEPPPFVMLLRKHLEGARVVSVEQPRWERILEIGCARGGSGGSVGEPARPTWLVIEIMGRLSNLVLRDDEGMILGALRLVSAQVNRYRTLLPNEPYRPPPPQSRTLAGQTLPRLDGERVTAADLQAAAQEMLASAGSGRKQPRLAGMLAANVQGFSQEMGREIAARALGVPDAPLAPSLDWERVAGETRDLASLIETRTWRPTLVLGRVGRDTAGAGEPEVEAARVYADGDEPQGEPIAFAVYEPRQYAGAVLRPMPGVSAMLTAYYRRAEWRDAVEGAKADLRRILDGQRDRCRRKAEVLESELAALQEADQLREEGDVLLAFQSEIPPGAASFTIDNPFADANAGPAPALTIALDSQLSAVGNANRRFARYHKMRRAAAAIPPQIEANALELARIEQLRTDLALADTSAEIAQVRAEVADAGYIRGRRAQRSAPPGHAGRAGRNKSGKGAQGKGKGGQKAPAAGSPLRRTSSDGLVLLIGKNSRQNEEVTFHQASGGDLWLHARGVPGAHVIIKSGGRPVPESTLREAAALAAYYSQAREAGSVPVDYTEQRYVRHMKGGGPGMVTYERERSLHVAPADVAEPAR